MSPAPEPDEAGDRWLDDRRQHGGADEIALPEGRLWLCGKHFVAPDPAAALRWTGASVVVCLNEAVELAERYPRYVTWLRASVPNRAAWYPIPDLGAPDLDDATALVADLRARLGRGEGVLMHCGAGRGRAGTMAAALLMSYGASAEESVASVAAQRALAGPETGPQTELLHALAARR